MKRIVSVILSTILALGALGGFTFADTRLNDILVVLTKDASVFGKQYTTDSFGIDGIKSVENLNFYESEEKAKDALVNVENYQTILKITAEDESEDNLQRIFKQLEEIDWIESVEFDGEEEPADDLVTIIKERVNPLFASVHHGLEINDGTFADLEVNKRFENDNIVVFSFKSSTNEAIDGMVEWTLGNYYFDFNTGGEIYVYDKVNDELMFLDTAYENGIVTDDILAEFAENNYRNPEQIIFDTIKAEAEVNSRYEDYKDLEFEDFTFNVHYTSGLAEGIYIFDFQAKGEAYFDAIIDEQIGNYICTYCDGGHYLYAVYNVNSSTAKIGKLKDLYDSGEIGDDVMDDFYNNHGGASIRKVGDDYRYGVEAIVISSEIIKRLGYGTNYDGNDKQSSVPENEPIYVTVPVGQTADDIEKSVGDGWLFAIYADNAWSIDNLTDDGVMKTGSTFSVKNFPEKEYHATVLVRGDVAGGDDGLGDGVIDILDVVSTRSVIVNSGIEDLKTNNFVKFKASDMNSDNEIDILDVVIMRNIIVNG